MAEEYRVQLGFTPEAFGELESLKVSVGAASRAEVFRFALRLLQWAIEEIQSGGEILVRKDGETEKVIFPFLNLSKAGEKQRNREVLAR